MPVKPKPFEYEYHRLRAAMTTVLQQLSLFQAVPTDTKSVNAFNRLVDQFTEDFVAERTEEHARINGPDVRMRKLTASNARTVLNDLAKRGKLSIEPVVKAEFLNRIGGILAETQAAAAAEAERKRVGQLRGYKNAIDQKLDQAEAKAAADSRKAALKAKRAVVPKQAKLTKEQIAELKAIPRPAIDLHLYDLQMKKTQRLHNFVADFFDRWSTKNKKCELASGPEDQPVICPSARSKSKSKSKARQPAFACLTFPCRYGDQNAEESKSGQPCNYSSIKSPKRSGKDDDKKKKCGTSTETTTYVPKPTKRRRNAGASKSDDETCQDAASTYGSSKHQIPRAIQAVVGRRIASKDQRALLLAWKAGSGKSLAAVLAAECALEAARLSGRKKMPKVVVVTKKSLISNFKKNIKRYGRSCEWIADNYVFYANEWLSKGTKAVSIEDMQKTAVGSIMIIDESHVLRHPIRPSDADDPQQAKKGKQSAAAIAMARSASKILLMTGTPLVNSVQDLYNTALMFTDDLAGFTAAFPYAESMDAYPKYSDQQMAALDEAFGCKISTIDLGNPPEGFPSSSEQNVLVQMDDKFLKAYQKIEDDITGDFTAKDYARFLVGSAVESSKDKSSFHLKLREAVNALPDTAKLKFVLARAKANRDAGNTLVIHSQFICSGLDKIRTALKSKGYKVAEISGDVGSTSARDCAVELFNSRKIDVLLISRAGATGIDLKGASEMINLEAFWNEAEKEQANARVARFLSHIDRPAGQKRVKIYNLFLAKPADMEKYYIRMMDDHRLAKPGAADDVLLVGVTKPEAAKITAAYTAYLARPKSKSVSPVKPKSKSKSKSKSKPKSKSKSPVPKSKSRSRSKSRSMPTAAAKRRPLALLARRRLPAATKPKSVSPKKPSPKKPSPAKSKPSPKRRSVSPPPRFSPTKFGTNPAVDADFFGFNIN